MKDIFKIMLVLLLFSACTEKSEYHKLVTTELAKKERHDSLFLDIYLGMTRKEFYAHCWELNKKGLMRQGSENATVSYPFDDLKYPARMNFYPLFKEDKIVEMPVALEYDGWAPWNRDRFPDSLEIDLVQHYEKVYGDGFIKVDLPNEKHIMVKVDGNRQIIIKQQEKDVLVTFSDLLEKPEFN